MKSEKIYCQKEIVLPSMEGILQQTGWEFRVTMRIETLKCFANCELGRGRSHSGEDCLSKDTRIMHWESFVIFYFVYKFDQVFRSKTALPEEIIDYTL